LDFFGLRHQMGNPKVINQIVTGQVAPRSIIPRPEHSVIRRDRE